MNFLKWLGPLPFGFGVFVVIVMAMVVAAGHESTIPEISNPAVLRAKPRTTHVCEPLIFKRRHDKVPKCGVFVEWHMGQALIEGTDGVWYLVRKQEILTRMVMSND